MRPYFLYLFLTVFLPFSTLASISHLGQEKAVHARKAFNYALSNNFERAYEEAKATKDQTVADLVLWIQYQSQESASNYNDMITFAKRHPNWPRISRIQTLAEYTLPPNTPATTLINYFTAREPNTNYAKLLLAQAKITLNPNDTQINSLLHDAWVETDFSPASEKQFLRDYGDRIKTQDYIARIDRLLWEQKITPAKRILSKVDKAHQLAFQARIYLMGDHQAAASSVAKVPPSLLNEPGFLYERIAWHNRRDRYDNVFFYMKQIKATMPYPEKWWVIRNRLLRNLLEKKHFSDAYEIAKHAYNTPGTVDYADSEWLAGWISLQFLHKPDDAYKHLYNMFQTVQSPISRSRASYWAGRAAEKNGNPTIANDWYTIAASFPTTFYGQLAHIKRFPNQSPVMPEFPVPSKEDTAAFKKNELVTAARVLVDGHQFKLAESFIKTAIEQAPTKGQLALISELGLHTNQEFLSVIASKEALRKGTVLSKTGYPVLPRLPESDVGSALILSIIRQESLFNPSAVSPANAVGFMQLLPSTARKVSEQLKLRYTYSKLIGDPYFNVQLGSSYIDQLYNRAGQSYLIAIASYNAGPGNVMKWTKTYGDPRKLSTLEDVIDWIELIPFSETRNYVQRVLENKQIYQYLIENKPFTLAYDIVQEG